MAKAFTFDVKKGALHKRLGIPEGQDIPLALLRRKLVAAKKAKDTEFIRQLVFALNAKTKFKHPKRRGAKEELQSAKPEKL